MKRDCLAFKGGVVFTVVGSKKDPEWCKFKEEREKTVR